MTSAPLLEESPIYLRVFAKPKRSNKRGKPEAEPPNDEHVLVLDTETTTDVQQELRFGIAREYALGHLCRTIVFTGTVTDVEMARIVAWAKTNHADVLLVDRFVLEVFIPLALDMRAVVVGFNLPFDLARLAVDWEPKERVGGKEHWSLWFVPRCHPHAAHVPRLRVQRVDSTKGFIAFAGTKNRWRKFRGAFVDLRTFVHVLTGEKHSLKTAGEAFGCKLKKTEADYHGPVNARYIDYTLNDVALTAQLYEKCLARFQAFGIEEHQSRLYSPASLAKAALRARGIVPPRLPPEWTGRIISAFYAGKVECRVQGHEVSDVAVLDFTSQFPSLWCLLGADRIQVARTIRTRRSTEQVRAWLDSLTVADLFRPKTWHDSRMWTLCEVEAGREILPIRSTYSGDPSQPATIGWNHVSTEPGTTLGYLAPDLIAAKLLSGQLPRIVRAITFEPVDRQDVRPITLLGVEIGVNDDMVRALSEARIHEKTTKAAGYESRSRGLKILSNALAYGISVEVNRKRKAGTSTVYGLGEDPFEWEDTETEEPGEDYCPLLGATLTSASHLLLALAETVVEGHGGEVAYSDTDSVFITPSRIAPEVTTTFDSLNPYAVPTHFLKDETQEKAPPGEYPEGSPDTSPRFLGLSCKRYCLFVRDRHGKPHVFPKAASDHGLGSFEVGGDRKGFVASVWEAIIEGRLQAGERFAGIPATAQFAFSSPMLLPRVRELGPIRPFTFMTARFLEPSALSDGWRSKLVPFISKDDTAAWDALMDLPGQRSWGSVVEAFVRHKDRKCRFDSEGRMVRRNILVRKSRIHGLGKEANRIDSARVLGVGPTGARAQVYVPWTEQILNLPLSWAVKHGIDKRNFARLRKRLRKGKVARGYRGGLLERVQRLLSDPLQPVKHKVIGSRASSPPT
jgi:hypothetical protein